MKFHQILIMGLFATALTACSGHNLYLVGRKSGATGTARIVTTPFQTPGGDVSVVIQDKTYTGKWVYMANGGMVGIGTGTALSGTQSATATSTIVGAPLQGNGSILASAADGSRLRCVFNYNQWNNSGVGTCEDSKGEVYDLQIN